MKRLFLLLLLMIPLSSYGQHDRLIVFGGSAWFPFDPLSGSYRSGSLAQLASYVEAWSEETDIDNVYICASKNFMQKTPSGYQTYHYNVDSTLIRRIYKFLNVTDNDNSKFDLSKYNIDSLANKHILVIDRWDFFGDVNTSKKVVNIGDFPISKSFMETFSDDEQAIKRHFSSPIANLGSDFSTRGMYFEGSKLGNLLHNFQLQYGDVSIIAPPKFDMTWKKGDLYIKDVYEMFTYNNDLSVVTSSGKLLKEFMEEVYGGRFFTYKRKTDDLVKIRTPYFFHDGFAGVEFEVNVSNNKGKRVQNHNIDQSKMYKIALSSFRAKWFIDKGCDAKIIDQYRVLLVKWIANTNINNLKNVEKWNIVPNVDITETIKRERESIFQ